MPADKLDTRTKLTEAFRHAVDGEHRFGIRGDCRGDLDMRWEKVIGLIEELCRKPKK